MGRKRAATKVCKICKADKPLSEFCTNKLTRDGKDIYCHACKAAKSRERRMRPDVREKERTYATSERGRTNARERMRRYRERLKSGQPTPTRNRHEPTPQEIEEAKERSRKRALEYSRSERGHEKRRAYHESGRRTEVVSKYKRGEKGKAAAKRYYDRNKDRNGGKIIARRLAQAALRDGKIVRPDACEMRDDRCDGDLSMHHDDYTRPVNVRWLCKYHHAKVHSKNESEG